MKTRSLATALVVGIAGIAGALSQGADLSVGFDPHENDPYCTRPHFGQPKQTPRDNSKRIAERRRKAQKIKREKARRRRFG